MSNNKLQKQLQEERNIVRSLQIELEETNKGIMVLTLELEKANEKLEQQVEQRTLELRNIQEVLTMSVKELKRKLKEAENTIQTLQTELTETNKGMLSLTLELEHSKERIRNHMKKDLQREKNLSKFIINSLPGIFFIIDKNRRLIRWNKNLEKISGYSLKEISNMNILDFFLEKNILNDKLKEVFDKGRLNFEINFISKNGISTPFYFMGKYKEIHKDIFLIGVGIDISDRKRAEEKLKIILNRLEISNKELEQFAYIASHDLQEPLRMISSYVQLLAKRYKGKLDDEADDFIYYAVDGTNRMKQLINDLLTYSRVGTRGKPFDRVDCDKILDRALNNLTKLIEENSAIIIRNSLPEVMADGSQMEQLFQNLISNAIKFRNKAPPRILISAENKNENWIFSVQDNGIGIDPEYFERIFVIFQRLHTREEYPGTGIGLALCKKIVERHKGKIWVDSQLGEGATFYFTIPERIEIKNEILLKDEKL